MMSVFSDQAPKSVKVEYAFKVYGMHPLLYQLQFYRFLVCFQCILPNFIAILAFC